MNSKSRHGRQTAVSSFVPYGTQKDRKNRQPSTEVLGYFRVSLPGQKTKPLSLSKPLPPPQEMNGMGGLSWLEYDPQHETLYLMKMGSDLFRRTLKK